MVGIGTSLVGKELVKHLELNESENIVFADPENALHDALDLNRGIVNTFFNPATAFAMRDRIFGGGMNELNEVLAKWKDAFYIPPKRNQAFNMGATLIFRGNETLFAHLDASPGDHADTQRVIDLAIKAVSI